MEPGSIMAERQTLKKRQSTMPSVLPAGFGAGIKENAVDDHPAGAIKHGSAVQILRLALFATYFWACCFRYVWLKLCYFREDVLTRQ